MIKTGEHRAVDGEHGGQEELQGGEWKLIHTVDILDKRGAYCY
jgi:hypothetical protein